MTRQSLVAIALGVRGKSSPAASQQATQGSRDKRRESVPPSNPSVHSFRYASSESGKIVTSET